MYTTTPFFYPISSSTIAYLNPCCYVINCCGHKHNSSYIPIRIDLRPYVLPHTWDDPNELPSMSGDRYFLKIYSPYLDNSVTTPKDTPYNHIKIDKYGIYSNTALLGLLPSPTRNIRGCYRIEYWRWNKELVLPTTNLGCKVECGIIKPTTDVHPSTNLLKTEWWYVHNKVQTCKFTGYRDIQMIRKDNDNLPLPNNTDYIPTDIAKDILLIEELNGIPIEYINDWKLVVEETKGPFHPQIKEKVVINLGIQWGIGPRTGTSYTIKYKVPLDIYDVLYKPTYREQDLLNINTY